MYYFMEFEQRLFNRDEQPPGEQILRVRKLIDGGMANLVNVILHE